MKNKTATTKKTPDLQRYKLSVEEDSFWEMEVEVDLNHPELPKALEEMVMFWTRGEERLEFAGGDYLKAFLGQLAEWSYRCVVGRNYGLNGLLDYYADLEGYCPMDGSYGIKILQVEGSCQTGQCEKIAA